MHRLLAGVEALREATEAQLVAARSLDVAGVQRWTRRRTELLFELEVARQEPIPDEVEPELKASLQALARTEARLGCVLDAVVRSFGGGTDTYDRSGRIGGGRD